MIDDAPSPRPAHVGGAAAPRPVRLALLLDALEQPEWIRAVLDRVAADGTATLVGVGVTRGAEAVAAPGPAHSAYMRFDTRRYGRPDHMTRRVDLRAHLRNTDMVDVPGRSVDGCWSPDAEGVERLLALDPDVVWYLGRGPLAEPAPVMSAWGTWALDPVHGSDGARAVCDGVPTTVTVLRRVAEAGADAEVVAVARTSTDPTSVAANHAEHVRHLVALLTGAVARAARGSRVRLDDASGSDARPRSELGTADVARMAVRIAAGLVRTKWQDIRTSRRWFLAYHLTDRESIEIAPDSGEPCTDPHLFTDILPPEDRYWADPFPVAWDGRHYVFYEEHLAGVRDAHLSVAELDPERGLVNARVVLRRPYHLSFPSVFRWNGAWYMTPETATEGVVQLYRAAQFPDEWTYVGDLLRGEWFVDPVVAKVDGRWWMFVGVLPTGTREATALHLYYADTPLGPWIPHALNPAAVDVRVARPAGRVFRQHDAWYRPVQDGVPHYGHAMTIHRIDDLTPSTFHETPGRAPRTDLARGPHRYAHVERGRAPHRDRRDAKGATPVRGSALARRPMHILWLKTELLHPVDKGGRIRTYNMLRALCRDHRVTYLALDDGTAAPDAVERSAEYCHTLVRVPFSTAPKRSARFFAELARNLASPLPYAVAKYRSPAMRDAVRQAVAAGVDVLVCDFLFPSLNVPDGLGVPTVLFQHNVEAVIWRRHVEVAENVVTRTYMREQWRRMRRHEAVECHRFDHVIAVSPQDTETMARDYGVRDVSDVPTGVDTAYFHPSGHEAVRPNNLVFTGSMDWMPNEDAILWFARRHPTADPRRRARHHRDRRWPAPPAARPRARRRGPGCGDYRVGARREAIRRARVRVHRPDPRRRRNTPQNLRGDGDGEAGDFYADRGRGLANTGRRRRPARRRARRVRGRGSGGIARPCAGSLVSRGRGGARSRALRLEQCRRTVRGDLRRDAPDRRRSDRGSGAEPRGVRCVSHGRARESRVAPRLLDATVGTVHPRVRGAIRWFRIDRRCAPDLSNIFDD